ncbi:hypothetical protein B0H13DRAFT_2331824 [Mycena leptocephala]|nr:hypothetical protein B0H13DRAFT_2331824 [Mycena leptocephala]
MSTCTVPPPDASSPAADGVRIRSSAPVTAHSLRARHKADREGRLWRMVAAAEMYDVSASLQLTFRGSGNSAMSRSVEIGKWSCGVEKTHSAGSTLSRRRSFPLAAYPRALPTSPLPNVPELGRISALYPCPTVTLSLPSRCTTAPLFSSPSCWKMRRSSQRRPAHASTEPAKATVASVHGQDMQSIAPHPSTSRGIALGSATLPTLPASYRVPTTPTRHHEDASLHPPPPPVPRPSTHTCLAFGHPCRRLQMSQWVTCSDGGPAFGNLPTQSGDIRCPSPSVACNARAVMLPRTRVR